MKSLLRSPLHSLISKSIMLITFTGRRSGKAYSTPVNYFREGDLITAFSLRSRTWWRNLRGSAPVTVKIRGQDLKAIGESVEDEKAVAAGLLAYLQKVPNYAKYFQVSVEPDGNPDPEEVVTAAKDRVMVVVRLTHD